MGSGRLQEKAVNRTCDFHLFSGTQIVAVGMPSHLFTTREIEQLFAPFIQITDLRAMDLLSSRFKPVLRWNGPVADRIPCQERLLEEFERLEELYCRELAWRDYGNHILLVGRTLAG